MAHIQNHLDKNDWPMARLANRIPEGEVGCKICEKGIYQIYDEEWTFYDAKSREDEKK